MDWNHLPHFLALYRTRSLAAAGRQLGVAATTVSRHIASLETHLGARLFDRTPNGLSPTTEGERVAALAIGVEAQMSEFTHGLADIAARDDAPTGRVRISATETVCSDILAPGLGALSRAYPHIHVDLLAQAEIVSLAQRESDIAIRMIRPKGQSIVLKKLAQVSLGFYASREYAVRHRLLTPNGDDTGPNTDDITDVITDVVIEAPVSVLQHQRFLGYDDSYGPIAETMWFTKHGLEHALVMRTGSTRALIAATVAGAGIGLLPQYMAMREPNLIALAAPAPLPTRTVFLAVHEDLHRLARIRVTIDFIVRAFTAAGL